MPMATGVFASNNEPHSLVKVGWEVCNLAGTRLLEKRIAKLVADNTRLEAYERQHGVCPL